MLQGFGPQHSDLVGRIHYVEVAWQIHDQGEGLSQGRAAQQFDPAFIVAHPRLACQIRQRIDHALGQKVSRVHRPRGQGQWRLGQRIEHCCGKGAVGRPGGFVLFQVSLGHRIFDIQAGRGKFRDLGHAEHLCAAAAQHVQPIRLGQRREVVRQVQDTCQDRAEVTVAHRRKPTFIVGQSPSAKSAASLTFASSSVCRVSAWAATVALCMFCNARTIWSPMPPSSEGFVSVAPKPKAVASAR